MLVVLNILGAFQCPQSWFNIRFLLDHLESGVSQSFGSVETEKCVAGKPEQVSLVSPDQAGEGGAVVGPGQHTGQLDVGRLHQEGHEPLLLLTLKVLLSPCRLKVAMKSDLRQSREGSMWADDA